MRRKGLIGKENKGCSGFLSSLEYSYLRGDNLMAYKEEHESTRLEQELSERLASLKPLSTPLGEKNGVHN